MVSTYMQSVVVISIALALLNTLNFFCSSSMVLASNSLDVPLAATQRNGKIDYNELYVAIKI